MTQPTESPAQPSRGGYFIPSALTVGNMFLGFLALVVAVQDRNYHLSALLIFGAAFLDGMDGRLARRSGTESEFGKEYDSLADALTFCLMPGLIAWFWGLDQFGRIGWLIPFFYTVCGLTRLARFNVQAATVDRRFFVGLPTPAAAGLVGSILFFFSKSPASTTATYPAITGSRYEWVGAPHLLLFVLPVLGLLMLSTFRYWSFKEFGPKRRWSYRVVLPILAVVVFAAFDPETFFLAVSGVYAVSGPLGSLRSRFRSRKSAESTPLPTPPDQA